MARKINNSYLLGLSNAPTDGGDMLKTRADGTLVWEEVEGTDYRIQWYGERGVFAQTANSNDKSRIQYITISSTGNSTDFGDIVMVQSEGQGGKSCSNGSRGIIFGGGYPSINVIQYFTISTLGNASDFGDMIQRTYNGGALSNGLRGVHGGGAGIDDATNIIEYITIATTGNSTDFGNLLDVAESGIGGFCDGSRGCFAGKISASAYGIQYITVATTGNATDFGDLSDVRSNVEAVDGGGRGVIGCGRGGAYKNTMDYVTIASTGNALDFGDATVSAKARGAAANGTRGVWAGGNASGTVVNVMDYITISSTGNATDFGDLLEVAQAIAGCSGD
tara:strand:+ start:892 stop:1896 length:1005 start_codon:yes stop_codon:yes gene_type:complete